MAPAGCLTLGETGLVLEANLSAAEIPGVARDNLLKQPFAAFIEKADHEGYYRHRKELYDTGAPQHCGLRMRRQDGRALNVCLKAIITHDDAGEAVCRLAVIECEHDILEESLQGIQK